MKLSETYFPSNNKLYASIYTHRKTVSNYLQIYAGSNVNKKYKVLACQVKTKLTCDTPIDLVFCFSYSERYSQIFHLFLISIDIAALRFRYYMISEIDKCCEMLPHCFSCFKNIRNYSPASLSINLVMNIDPEIL